MLWIFLILTLLVVASFYYTRNFNYWKEKNVVFEPPVPIFGNLLPTALGIEGVSPIIKRSYSKFEGAPYFGMYFFSTPFLVVRSRELIKQILVSNFSSFPNRQTYAEEFIDPWSTSMLPLLRNEEWKSLRSKLSIVFTSGKMKLMMNLMKQSSGQLTAYLEKKGDGEIDVRELLKRYFVEIICICVFGVRPNNVNEERSHIRDMACRLLLNTESYKWIFFLILHFICPIFIKLCDMQFVDRSATDYLVKIFESSCKKRRESNVHTNDFVDLLLNLQRQEKEDDDFKLDDFKLASTALFFFHAGNEPSTNIISFCLWELALNKSIQDTLRAEIYENLDAEGDFSYDALMGMPYLNMVVKEALRKYPLVQILIRLAEKDHYFEGFKIEKGTNIVIPMSALHSDPEYFPNPDKFDPERYRGVKSKEFQNIYLAFGEGPRQCIGYRFAMMSMKLALAIWIRDFEVSISENTENPILLNKKAFLITQQSNNLYLGVRRIKKPNEQFKFNDSEN